MKRGNAEQLAREQQNAAEDRAFADAQAHDQAATAPVPAPAPRSKPSVEKAPDGPALSL